MEKCPVICGIFENPTQWRCRLLQAGSFGAKKNKKRVATVCQVESEVVLQTQFLLN